MLGIQRIRELLPQQCEGKSDEQIAQAYHRQYYPQMDFDEFQRRFYAADAQGKKGRSGRSQSGSQGGSKGPDRTRQAMGRAGFGLDKDGNYFPYARDEKGKLVLDKKGARMLDYDRGAAEPEMIEEVLRKQNGQGLQRPQPAQQPAQPAAQQGAPAAETAPQPAQAPQAANMPPQAQQAPIRQGVAGVVAEPAANAAPQQYQPVDLGEASLPSGVVNGIAQGIGSVGKLPQLLNPGEGGDDPYDRDYSLYGR